MLFVTDLGPQGGVVQEKKSTKMKIGDLPDDLKKLVLIGAKTIQKANKENKST